MVGGFMDHNHNTINEKNHKSFINKNDEIKIWSVGDFIFNFYRQMRKNKEY